MRFLLALTILAAPGAAELLDRVAVTVGNQVITENEITDEIRMDAFLNNEPADFSEKSKRAAADRLIEQKLIYREMDMGRYPPAPPQEVNGMMDKLEKTRARSQGDFERALKAAGITQDQLREHLLWGLTLSSFIDLRFRPAVQVTRKDIQDYYQDKILPATKAGEKPNLADVRAQIEQTLTGERADRQLDAWLKDSKARARIEYRKEAFEDSKP
jgi:hypothetical protein